jgi:hypothetical protein
MLAKTTTLKDVTKIIERVRVGGLGLKGNSCPAENFFIWITSKLEINKEQLNSFRA